MVIIFIANQSKDYKKFWIFTAIILVLSVADPVATYIGSLDLSYEVNFLVSIFGLGWGALLTSVILLLSAVMVLVYYSFIKFKPSIIQCEGVKQYFSMLCFNHPDKFNWVFYKMPKNKRFYSYLFASFGFMAAIFYPIYKLVAVIEWVIFIKDNDLFFSILESYKNVFPYIPRRLGKAIISGVVVVVLLCYWFYKEYKINKNALQA